MPDKPKSYTDRIEEGRDAFRKMLQDDVAAAVRGANVSGEMYPGGPSALRRSNMPELYPVGDAEGNEPITSPAECFRSSDALKGWLERFPNGGPTGGGSYQSDPVKVPGSLRSIIASSSAGARALISSTDASAGAITRPNDFGLIEPGLVRPLTIRQLVSIVPITDDAFSYSRELSRVSAAAPVPEATASSAGGVGVKPQGNAVFERITGTARTFAEHVAVTSRALQDATELRQYVDSYLMYDVALEIEDQMVAGDGTGENFTGILNTPGIQTLAAPVGPMTNLDNLRQAIVLAQVNGRTQNLSVVLNPADSKNLDLEKINSEANHFAGSGPFTYQRNQPIWGMPRVESEALPAGTALVGDFSFARLFDRMQTTLAVGTINDDFIKNLVRILAEARAGFGVIRPAAFVKISLA